MHQQMNSLGEAALAYAAKRLAVFPAYGIAEGRCMCAKGSDCDSPGKHPIPRTGLHAATSDVTQIRRWWSQHPNANVCIRTGNGLAVLDVDRIESLAELEADHGPLPRTLTVLTGGGGAHYFFRTDRPLRNSASKVAPGIDVRGEGGYVVAPPSLHISGRSYSVQVDAPFANVPDWLTESTKQTPDREGSLTPRTIPDGQRNSTLFREACKLRRGGLTQEEGSAAIHEMNRVRCDPPLAESEVDKLVSSAFSYPRDTRHQLTDIGNATSLACLAGGQLLYVKQLGGWLTYENGRWAGDERNVAQEFAKEIPKELYAQAALTDDKARRKGIAAWARKSSFRGRIDAMIKLAQSVPELVGSVDDFDKDPWLLNVANGVIDLRTGELLPHDPKHRLTRLARAEWLGIDTPAPMWEEHIRYVLGDDDELIEFFQAAMGYTLSGLSTEQKLFVLHGLGANGKSVTLEVLRSVIGTYSAQTPAETLMVKRSGSTNDLARLRGTRFVTAVETDLGARLAEVLVKRMTGGDTITARYLYKEFFEFIPTFKVWLAVNHRPRIFGTDHAIWRRICLIPFEVRIPASKRDPRIAQKLRREASGILSWLLRGCLRWQKEGLTDPPAVSRAVAQYREEEDPIGAFLLSCCVMKKGEWTTAADLYRAYESWALDVGEEPIKPNMFGLLLGEHGFKKDRKGPRRATRWLGIALGTAAREEPDF